MHSYFGMLYIFSFLESTCQGQFGIDIDQEFSAHAGMLEAALNIYRELIERHVINQALSQCPDADIVLTGHSLGAGTASILGFILRAKYSNTYVYAFGPPGGLLNDAALREAQKFIVSVVCGDDFISRLSIDSIYKLRSKMEDVLLQCDYPKHKILNWALTSSLSRCLCCFCCFSKNEEDSAKWQKRLEKARIKNFQNDRSHTIGEEVLDTNLTYYNGQERRNSSVPIITSDINEYCYGSTLDTEDMSDLVRNQVDTVVVIESQAVNSVQSAVPNSDRKVKTDASEIGGAEEHSTQRTEKSRPNQIHAKEGLIPKMFPPGKLIHLDYGQNRNIWHMRYMKEHELSEIKVSEFMATDHFPQAYINGLTYISSHLLNNTIVHV